MSPSSEERPAAPPYPGQQLLRPVPLVAVVVLVLNDHWWKAAFDGWWTGKLSDVAGLAFFPLLLQALWEGLQAVARCDWQPSRRALLVAAATAVVGFALVKLWGPAGDAFRWGLAAAQWPLHALAALAQGTSPGTLRPVGLVRDATDLLALPAVLLGVASGWRRSEAPRVSAREAGAA